MRGQLPQTKKFHAADGAKVFTGLYNRFAPPNIVMSGVCPAGDSFL
jgi:hypothetical protein